MHLIDLDYNTLLQESIFIIGVMLFLVNFFHRISDKLKMPHVIGYMLLGVFLGSSFFSIISENMCLNLEIITSVALAMIGFSIGGELEFNEIKAFGWSIPIITFCETFGAFFLVLGGLYIATRDIALSLLFASVAGASAPAATAQVLWQYMARGPLTTTIFAVVGLDDAFVLIIYAFARSFLRIIITHKTNISFIKFLVSPAKEIAFSVIAGFILGVLLNYALKYAKGKKEVKLLTIGAIALGAGISRAFHLSLILTCMTIGMTLINIDKKNEFVFNEVNDFFQPFVVILFVVTGAHLNVWSLASLGVIGIVYILTRAGGLIFGAWLGATLSKAEENVRKYLGLGILSQAGVAIGLAIDTTNTISKINPHAAAIAAKFITIIAATTIIFELLGPSLVKYAIFKAKEVDPSFLQESNK